MRDGLIQIVVVDFVPVQFQTPSASHGLRYIRPLVVSERQPEQRNAVVNCLLRPQHSAVSNEQTRVRMSCKYCIQYHLRLTI